MSGSIQRRTSNGRPVRAVVERTVAAHDVPEVEVDVIEEVAVDVVWRVILFNDDVHTFEEVIHQLVLATGCSSTKAERLAWQVHTQGKAVVFDGEFEECFRVQSVLREIELITELRG